MQGDEYVDYISGLGITLLQGRKNETLFQHALVVLLSEVAKQLRCIDQCGGIESGLRRPQAVRFTVDDKHRAEHAAHVMLSLSLSLS